MVWWILFIFTIILTSVSARFLIVVVQEGPVYFRNREFSVSALRLSRYYRILSWSIVTVFMLGTLVQLFIQAIEAV